VDPISSIRTHPKIVAPTTRRERTRRSIGDTPRAPRAIPPRSPLRSDRDGSALRAVRLPDPPSRSHEGGSQGGLTPEGESTVRVVTDSGSVPGRGHLPRD